MCSNYQVWSMSDKKKKKYEVWDFYQQLCCLCWTVEIDCHELWWQPGKHGHNILPAILTGGHMGHDYTRVPAFFTFSNYRTWSLQEKKKKKKVFNHISKYKFNN